VDVAERGHRWSPWTDDHGNRWLGRLQVDF
jgi:hypothetical protein